MTDRNCLHVVPLPPRKRLLAGFKKNGWSYPPPPPSSSSSSSSSPSSFPDILATGNLQVAEPTQDPGNTHILHCKRNGDRDEVNNRDGDLDGVDNGDGNGHGDRDGVKNGDGNGDGVENGDGDGDGIVDTNGKIYVTISDDDDDRAVPSSSLLPPSCSPSNQSSSLTSDRAESDLDLDLDVRTDGTPTVSEVNEEERAPCPTLTKRGRVGKLHKLSTTGDEEFAMQLHRAMNSSPRISRKRTGVFQGSDKARDGGARNGHARKSTGLGAQALQRMPP